MTILAIDPGYIESAYCLYDGKVPLQFDKVRNETLMEALIDFEASHLVIEKMQGFGMAVGIEVFDTVFVSGRICERWESMGRTWCGIPRKEVAGHICHSGRAKDSNIRTALMDRYGGEKAAKGLKKSPGPLYGMAADMFSAFAIAITWWETHGTKGA